MNFNLNSINKRIVLYLSLIGFILSFISGVVSGNSFGVLFIRSLLSGIAIGVVIAIANIVIAIYIPELLESEEADDVDDEGDSHVNIVMPEEKYKVQAGDGGDLVGDGVVSDAGAEDSNSSFKEVDLDNLKSLSSSSSNNYTNDVEDFSDSNSSSQMSSKDATGDFGNHSVDEMAKAVKTVLKKD